MRRVCEEKWHLLNHLQHAYLHRYLPRFRRWSFPFPHAGHRAPAGWQRKPVIQWQLASTAPTCTQHSAWWPNGMAALLRMRVHTFIHRLKAWSSSVNSLILRRNKLPVPSPGHELLATCLVRPLNVFQTGRHGMRRGQCTYDSTLLLLLSRICGGMRRGHRRYRGMREA